MRGADGMNVLHSSRAAVAACMRNEGPFLLEWIAYYRAIGFDEILVATNDCTDGTDEILDRLQDMGLAHHIRNEISAGEAPQVAGMRRVLDHPIVLACDWLLHVDADEFLNVAVGDGMIGDLLKTVDFADNVAIMWRPFGTSGLDYWRGGSVLSAFTRTQGRPRPANAGHKSLFRPRRFSAAIDHMPKAPVAEDVICVNAMGERVSARALFHPTRARYRMADDKLTWDGACINHYATRSTDVFLMKNDRGDGMGRRHEKYFLNSTFYRRHNKNEVEDHSILRNKPAVDRLLSEMLTDETLRRLDRRALDIFTARRDEVLTPERIAQWTL